MSSKYPPPIHTRLSPTLNMTQDHHGFWIWDETQKMNLAMKEKTERDAFVSVIGYYQKRLNKVEKAHDDLQAKVDGFLAQFPADED